MKHPDDTQAAIDFMTAEARSLIAYGMETDAALDRSIDRWRRSLLRAQMMIRFNDDLRGRGKPTLHVSLFEAAKIR